MKRILFIGIILTGLHVIGQSKEQARATIWDMLNRNNSDAHKFMTDLYAMPTKLKSGSATITMSPPTDFMVFVQGYDRQSILSDISTVVHEACHMYQGQMPNVLLSKQGVPIDFKSDYTVYFISAQEEYLVKHTPTFPSIKMAAEITGSLQSFRYETYIKTNETNLGTQQSGIYGLMDEWAAYYNGFKTTVQNFEEYAAYTQQSIDPIYDFLGDAGSIRIAYPEFRFYIVHYLDFARRNQKEMYEQIMANDTFRAAYRAIDRAFGMTINKYTDKLNKIGQLAELKGLKVQEKGDYLMIGDQGIGTFQEAYVAFETAMADPKYAAIHAALAR